MAQVGCSSVIAGTAYATATVTTLIPTITGTRTQVVAGPAETSFSTIIGTIRGIPTTQVFTVEVPGVQTTLIPVSGYLTSLVLQSTPVSYIYSTVCPTTTPAVTPTTTSTLSTSTTTSTTTTSTTTSAPPSTISSRTTTTTTTTPPPSSSSSSSTISSSTTTPAQSTSTSFVIVPASSSSSGNTSATALSNAANGKNNSSSSNTGAIAGGVVGGIAVLAVLAGLGFWFFRRRSNKHEHEFDPFSNDDPWNPAVEGMGGGAAGAGGYGAARYSKADELAYADGGHHLNSSTAGLAGAGAAAAFGYGGAHGRSRSDHSHEKGDAAYYAPVSSAGSPPRRTSRRKAPPSAEQHEMYYTGGAGGGNGMSSDGHGGEYGYASAYDDPAMYGSAHDADPYGQQYYPPPQQQPQVPYGQPGGLMQYPGQGAPTYPPQQQQQAVGGGGGGGAIAYHHSSSPSDGRHSYGATGNEQEYLSEGAAAMAPPSALVPGNVASPAPSHRSIPHLGAMQFEHDPMPMPGQGHQALRVMNDAEDPYGGMDDAQQQQHYYHHQQQQQYGGAYHQQR
ncbi:hypothetical protein BMF94_4917 [Rhodotorula taiwanensis]|uniref:Uncharacterized protein n=1 Tax=Rhodotorula taiwanensis TaxID=741276 RepID=A0A2S5B5J8_9BASI|nr:hypothetical protein BMF94_4917 [Rhodotorula taiwanensis]